MRAARCACCGPVSEHGHITRRRWLELGSATALLASLPTRVAAKLAGTAIDYDFIASGAVQGSMRTTILPGGRRAVRFQYNDRGRGANLVSAILFDTRGFIESLHTTGYNYFKTPVDETFVARNGSVRWKNEAERENHTAPAPRFYVSYESTSEETAALARALLEAKRPVPLWPDGEARLEVGEPLHLSSGHETRVVTLYEILGLDYTPTQVWLDERRELFMWGSTWGAIVPTGWKAALSQLFAAQDARSAARGRSIASANARRPGAIAITGCTLFDAKAATLVPDRTIVVDGDKIAAVGGPDTAVPGNALHINGTGSTVLPGLWDMHMHMSASLPAAGPLTLAQGVTTVRDPGNNFEYVTQLQKQTETGELAGPRILIAGMIDGVGPYQVPTGLHASDAKSASEAVQKWHDAGAVQIKLYSSLDPALVPAIVQQAHGLGMRVSGHIPAGMLAEDAVRAGFDEIQHSYFLFLNFMPDVKDKTMTPLRLTATSERAGTIDLASPEVSAFVKLLKDRGTVCDPTLSIVDSHHWRQGDVESTGYAAVAGWLPSQLGRALAAGGLPVPAGKQAAYDASRAAGLKLVALLHANGVPIVAGTDDIMPGFGLVRELELYVKAGFTTAEALQSATIVPARVMKMDATLGSIEAGKLADLIVVRGNPLADILQLHRVETTIKGGVVYDSRALYATAGVNAPSVAAG